MIEQTPGDLVLWGWVLLISGTLALAFFIYRLIWLERYRRPTSAEPLVRIQGQVAEPPGTVVYCVGDGGDPIIAEPFRLRGEGNESWMVQPKGAVLSLRGYRQGGRVIRGLIAGEIVTIDGVPTTLSHGEQLYRQSGRTPAIDAVRITGGSWPELRWLRIPMFIAMATFLLSLGQILLAPGSAADDRGVAQSLIHEPICSGLGGARFTFSRKWQAVTDLEEEESFGLGRLIGDQPHRIHFVEDHLVYQP